MPIKVYRTPQRKDVAAFAYSVQGETLTIDGTPFDLSGVTEPHSVGSDFVAGPVFRQDGYVHVQLVIPYSSDEEPCEHENMPLYVNPLAAEPVITVYSVDFWTRLDGGTDGNSGEVAQVLAAMELQPIRTRKIFEAANSYRSDHELWPLLQQLATSLFGAERAAEILAPSGQ